MAAAHAAVEAVYLCGDEFEMHHHQVQDAQTHESRHQSRVHGEELEGAVAIDTSLAVVQGAAAADNLQQQLCGGHTGQARSDGRSNPDHINWEVKVRSVKLLIALFSMDFSTF